MESVRQSQVNKIIQVSLSEVFQRDGSKWFGNALVTISSVKTSPDLQNSKIYLSIYNANNPQELIQLIDKQKREIRGHLGRKIRNKVRVIPEIEFFRDDTMDEVIKLDKLFKEIKEKDESIEELRKNSDFEDTNPYKE